MWSLLFKTEKVLGENLGPFLMAFSVQIERG